MYKVSLLTIKLSENSTAKIYNYKILNYNREYKTKGTIKPIKRIKCIVKI